MPAPGWSVLEKSGRQTRAGADVSIAGPSLPHAGDDFPADAKRCQPMSAMTAGASHTDSRMAPTSSGLMVRRSITFRLD